MKIKGTCTAIDYRTISFVLDEQITIFAALLFINKQIELPVIGDHIQIHQAKWVRRNEVYLQMTSTLTIQNKHLLVDATQEDNEIAQLITTICFKHSLTYNDLDHLNRTIKRIKTTNCFPLGDKLNDQLIHRICSDYIVLKCVDEVLSLAPSFVIKLPCDYYEKSAVRKLFKSWQLTNYQTNLNEYMIGLLHVYHHTGVLLLTDYNHSLPIVILCKNPTKHSQKLQKILNKYIYIKNYYVFKEEYSEIRTYKYIIVRIDDIHTLADGLARPLIPVQTSSVDIHFHYRSAINRNSAGKASCLTFAQLNFAARERNWYLRLEGAHLDAYPMVNEHDTFKLRCSNEFLKRLKDGKKEITYQVRTKESIPCYILPVDSQLEFSENKPINGPIVWQTVADICETIHDSALVMYSFDAIIDSRTVGPLCESSSDFGLPASEIIFQLVNVHPSERIGYEAKVDVFATYEEQLEAYERRENAKKPRITVILDKWDHKHYPLGLIPNMRVRLLNWIPDAERIFLKSCLTSSITPIDYPRIDFTSADVDVDNWGDPWPLGLGMYVPFGTICWGQIETIFIRSLVFDTDCVLCKEFVMKGVCVACKNSDLQSIRLRGKILLYVKDDSGKCEVITSELCVIRVLLDLDADEEWVLIARGLKAICPFDFKFLDDQTDYVTKFENELVCFIRNINSNSAGEYDLKCRRIDKDRVRTSVENSHIQWYCLQARVAKLPLETVRCCETNSRRVWI